MKIARVRGSAVQKIQDVALYRMNGHTEKDDILVLSTHRNLDPIHDSSHILQATIFLTKYAVFDLMHG